MNKKIDQVLRFKNMTKFKIMFYFGQIDHQKVFDERVEQILFPIFSY